ALKSSKRIAASAVLGVAKQPLVIDTKPQISGSALDRSNPFPTESRAVDGRLARADADRRRGRPRDHARAECLSDHGGALGARPVDAVSADPPQRRARGD